MSQATFLIVAGVSLALLAASGNIDAFRARPQMPQRVLSQAELQLFTTTRSSGEIVMAGSNGVVIDQGTQAIRVGTDAITFLAGTADSVVVRIGSDGNVGIGTTNSSTNRLTVQGAMRVNGASAAIELNDGNSGLTYSSSENAFVGTGTSAKPSNGPVLYGMTDGALGVKSGGAANALYWNSTGVGIGTNSPQYKLDVAGSVNLTGSLYQNGSLFKTSQWNTSGSDISFSGGKVTVGDSMSVNTDLGFWAGSLSNVYSPSGSQGTVTGSGPYTFTLGANNTTQTNECHCYANMAWMPAGVALTVSVTAKTTSAPTVWGIMTMSAPGGTVNRFNNTFATLTSTDTVYTTTFTLKSPASWIGIGAYGPSGSKIVFSAFSVKLASSSNLGLDVAVPTSKLQLNTGSTYDLGTVQAQWADAGIYASTIVATAAANYTSQCVFTGPTGGAYTAGVIASPVVANGAYFCFASGITIGATYQISISLASTNSASVYIANQNSSVIYLSATSLTSTMTTYTSAPFKPNTELLTLAFSGFTGGSNVMFKDVTVLRLDTNLTGNVGVGYSTPDYPLTISGSASSVSAVTTASTWKTQQVIRSSNNANMMLKLGSHYNATVGSYGSIQATDFWDGVEHPQTIVLNPLGGGVGIGTTNPGFMMCVAHSGSGTGGTAANFGLRVHNTWADGFSNTRNMILFTDRNSTQGAIGAYRDNYGNHFLGGLSFMVGSQPTGYTQNQPANTAQAESSLTEAMRITPAGNVGIGTSPSWPLTVKSAGWGVMCAQDSGPLVGLYAGGGMAYVGTNSNHNLNFCTNNSGPQMTLQATTGYVGIGTASPNASLHILNPTPQAGNTNMVTCQIIGRPATSGVQNNMSGGFAIGAASADSGAHGRMDIMVASYGSDANGWGFIPNTSVATFLGNGYVGIGTASPNQKLTVYGDGARMRVHSATANNAVLELGSGSWTSYMFTDQSGTLCMYPHPGQYKNIALQAGITNPGNVGIGSQTPVAKLTVYETSGAGWAGMSYFGGSTNGFVAGEYGGVATFGGHRTDLGAWAPIKTSSRIGIGTAAPNAPLHVQDYAYYQPMSSIPVAGGVNGGAGYSFRYDYTLGSHPAGWNVYLGIYSRYSIMTSDSFIAASDERIKKNIQPIVGALDKIRQLDVVSYDRIDYRERGVDAGVLARNVQSVLPKSVFHSVYTIPNIYSKASHVKIRSGVLIEVLCDDKDIKEGSKVKLMITKGDKEEEHVSPMTNWTGSSFEVEEWEEYDAEDKVFVYGVEVGDFMNVDKEQIGILAAGAVKELAQIVEEQRAQLVEQRAQLVEQRERIDKLERAIQLLLR